MLLLQIMRMAPREKKWSLRTSFSSIPMVAVETWQGITKAACFTRLLYNFRCLSLDSFLDSSCSYLLTNIVHKETALGVLFPIPHQVSTASVSVLETTHPNALILVSCVLQSEVRCRRLEELNPVHCVS